MRRSAVGVVILVGLSVSGCASSTQGVVGLSSSFSSPIVSAASSAAPPAVQAVVPQVVPESTFSKPATAVAVKEVGEEAGVGCTSDLKSDCTVLFIVTELGWGSEGCRRPVVDGQAHLRVTIETVAAPHMIDELDATSFLVENWGTVDRDGFASSVAPVAGCGPERGPFTAPVEAGLNQRSWAVFSVPAGAPTLYLAPPSTGGRWEWNIPPAQ